MRYESSHYRNKLRGGSIHSLLKKDECANIDGQGPSCVLASKKSKHERWTVKSRLRKIQALQPLLRDCVFLNRLQGCGIARGCSPLRDWEAVWLGKAH